MCWREDVGFRRRIALLNIFILNHVCVGAELYLWIGGAPSDRCLAHVLDLRWRQVNVAMWSTRFNFVIRIASIKFQKLTPARKDLKLIFYILKYYVIHLWLHSWSSNHEVYEVHALQSCICIIMLYGAFDTWCSLPCLLKLAEIDSWHK